jgi:uncharacterized protein (TIGR03089 family)
VSLADALLRPSDPRPMITWYDAATGERIELSGVTTANWAAKAANLLRDECDVEPGTRVAVRLPAHWQTAAVLLAAWWCGADVVAVGPASTGEADLVLCDAAGLEAAVATSPVLGVVALSLDAFGKGLSGLPSGVVDFATEVRTHGDAFVPWEPVPDNAPALDGEPLAAVLAAARSAAAARGLASGDRVLSTRDWTGSDLVEGLLAVLAAGASLVQVAHADDERVATIAASERTTHTL